MSPKIHNWHNPHREDCRQNGDPLADCTCKRVVKRKPYKVCSVVDDIGTGIKEKINIEIHPNGIMKLREKGRQFRVETTAGEIYQDGLRKEARRKWLARNAARLVRKKERMEKLKRKIALTK